MTSYISSPLKQNKSPPTDPRAAQHFIFHRNQMFKLWKTFPGSFHLLDCYPSLVHQGDPPDHAVMDEMAPADDAPLNECDHRPSNSQF
jgi:hypothetical protein